MAAMDADPTARAAGAELTGLRRLLLRAGLLMAAAVVAATVANGLPDSTGRAVAVVVLTTVAVGCWVASLAPQMDFPHVLLGLLVATGLAGAWLDILRPTGPGFVLVYMAVAGLGFQLPRRLAIAAAVPLVVAGALAETNDASHPITTGFTFALGSAFLFLAATFAAVNRDAHTQAQELLVQQEATRQAREEAAVLAERTRLARELHDVLAHTLSGLAIQLEGAALLARKVDADPRLVESVGNSARLAREGMASAKRAVATLRGESLPGPDDLPGLVETARFAGVPTTYEVHGPPRVLPAELGLAVYRTVQEALTNTRKHAGSGATATVRLDWAEDAVTVEITDAGGDRSPADLPSSGYGLAGLAERAALAGGHLEQGPTDDGFRVRLTLPLPVTP